MYLKGYVQSFHLGVVTYSANASTQKADAGACYCLRPASAADNWDSSLRKPKSKIKASSFSRMLRKSGYEDASLEGTEGHWSLLPLCFWATVRWAAGSTTCCLPWTQKQGARWDGAHL